MLKEITLIFPALQPQPTLVSNTSHESLTRNYEQITTLLNKIEKRLDNIEKSDRSSKQEKTSQTEVEKGDNNEEKTLLFNGKVQKIVTLASSYCSVRFVYYMTQQQYDKSTEDKVANNKKKSAKKKIKDS